MPRKPVLTWISPNEAAEMLGITPNWARTLLHMGKFPHVEKKGRTYLILKKDVEAMQLERAKKGKKTGAIIV